VLKEYTKAIWKDSGPSELFKQMKDYVDKMVPELISNEHITDLGEGVVGVNNALKAYDDTDIPEEKAKYLTSIETAIDIALEPKYFDSRAPEKALPYFVALGTVKLMVLREQYLHSRDYYCTDPKKYDCAKHQAGKLKKFNDAVAAYTAAAKTIKENAMKWRLGKLHVDEHTSTNMRGRGGGGSGHSYTAYDDACNWHPQNRGRDEDGANAQLALRWVLVRDAYNKDLDAILAPVAHWASLSDQAAPVVEPDHPAKKTDEKTTNKTPEATTETAVDLDSAEPGPPATDSKGCLPDGGFPVATITDNLNYQKLIRCMPAPVYQKTVRSHSTRPVPPNEA
jgi:hypothetical protein